MQSKTPQKPIVFYDGSCPLCKKEIRHYRKIDSNKALIWLDISQEPEALQQYSLTLKEAMEQLHCIDEMGKIVIGGYAFLMIWRHLPYYKGLSKMIRLCRAEGLLNSAYKRFAVWRFKRRCKNGSCDI